MDQAAQKAERERFRRERSHMQRLRISEAGVATAALLVSLTALGVNFFNYARGSEIVVLQPEQIVLYRTSGPSDASLWLAVQTQMVNATRNYGDVVVRASASVNDGPERFAYNQLVEPVVSPKAEAMAEDCPQGARCLPAKGFYVIERPKRLLDIPGGSSRTEYLAFQLESVNCRPEGDGCSTFSNYDSAVASFRRDQRLTVEVEVELQFDGTKRLRCSLSDDRQRRSEILAYLDDMGWATPECAEV